jgi:hypothetical protein
VRTNEKYVSFKRAALLGLTLLTAAIILLVASHSRAISSPGEETLSFGRGLPVQLVDPSGRNSVQFVAYDAPLTAVLQLYALSIPQFISLYNSLPTYYPDTWARSASLRCRISAEEVTLPAWIVGDFDRDCRVTDFDLRQVIVPWNTRAGEPGYDAARDMDRDGDVDVVDVVRVAANWGSVCSPHDARLFTLKAVYPSLRTEPVGLTVTAGVSYTVAVMLDEPTDLDGYQFRLRFDPTVVRVGNVAMKPGYGALGPHVSKAAGRVTCGAFRYGRGVTLSEDTSLAHVTFIGLQDGTTGFALEVVKAAQVGPPARLFLPVILRRAD